MAHGLPRMPVEESPAQAQVVRFGGLNYGQDGTPGELEDCRNLSAREFPCLSQRPGRQQVTEHTGVQAVYDHFGKLVVVKNQKLYVDGDEVCTVSKGAKQFAPVNSQLVVWPDKIVVDVEEKTAKQMDAKVTTYYDQRYTDWAIYDQTVTVMTNMTENSITAPLRVVLAKRSFGAFNANNITTARVFTYGKDLTKFFDCWTGTAWDMKKLESLAGEAIDVRSLPVGEIVFFDTTGGGLAFNDNGIPTPATDYLLDGTYGIWGGFQGSSSQYEMWITKYKIGVGTPQFSELFSVGDYVNITGTMSKLRDAGPVRIEAIDDQTNTMTFADGTFRSVENLWVLSLYLKLGKGSHFVVYLQQDNNGNYFKITMYCTKDIELNHWVLLAEVENGNIVTAAAWNPAAGEIIGDVVVVENVSGKYSSPPTPCIWKASNRNFQKITIQRAVPELDYICSADNRLWGVSNKDRTIYGSEQGKPLNFYSNADASSGSYSVAAGSDGEFTGCAESGDNIAFFKEDRVHLLVGKEPSSYALYDYQYHGVAKGSHASLVNINENLFYLSTDGVYAFSSAGSPALISAAFGTRRFKNGAAGTDGEKYYISMQDRKTSAWGLWVYDLRTGQWLQEDASQLVSYTNRDGVLHAASNAGNLYQLNPDNSTEKVEWSATLCRIDETMHERKCYSKLLLRYEMNEGSTMKAEISCDGGAWETLKEVRADTHCTSVLPIRPNRCDSFRIRLSGKGTVRLRSLVRSVITGGYV